MQPKKSHGELVRMDIFRYYGRDKSYTIILTRNISACPKSFRHFVVKRKILVLLLSDLLIALIDLRGNIVGEGLTNHCVDQVGDVSSWKAMSIAWIAQVFFHIWILIAKRNQLMDLKSRIKRAGNVTNLVSSNIYKMQLAKSLILHFLTPVARSDMKYVVKSV